MGSIATSDFSLANLLQTLTSSGSPQLAAELSSPAVQAALETAPSGDIVEVFDQALQMQEASLFSADSSTAFTPTIPAAVDPASSLLAPTSSAAPATAPTASLAHQLEGYQSDLQSQEMQTLFGVNAAGPPLSSLFNVLG
jgi:hypothetical protein